MFPTATLELLFARQCSCRLEASGGSFAFLSAGVVSALLSMQERENASSCALCARRTGISTESSTGVTAEESSRTALRTDTVKAAATLVAEQRTAMAARQLCVADSSASRTATDRVQYHFQTERVYRRERTAVGTVRVLSQVFQIDTWTQPHSLVAALLCYSLLAKHGATNLSELFS